MDSTTKAMIEPGILLPHADYRQIFTELAVLKTAQDSQSDQIKEIKEDIKIIKSRVVSISTNSAIHGESLQHRYPPSVLGIVSITTAMIGALLMVIAQLLTRG